MACQLLCISMFRFKKKTKKKHNSLYVKGYFTSYQKLVCFVLYLKIINTLKNNISIL